jgi:hypothetical protein
MDHRAVGSRQRLWFGVPRSWEHENCLAKYPIAFLHLQLWIMITRAAFSLEFSRSSRIAIRSYALLCFSARSFWLFGFDHLCQTEGEGV